MSLLHGWLRPDYRNPKERFIYLSGAPYDGEPKDAHSIRRLLRTPAFKASTITGLFVAAAVAFGAPPDVKQQIFVALSAAFPFLHALTRGLSDRLSELSNRAHGRPTESSMRVVIDKTGRAFSDPDAVSFVEGYYQGKTWGGLVGPAAFFLGNGVVTAFYLASGGHPPSHVTLAETYEAMTVFVGLFVAPSLSDTGWALYAQHQLYRGDKRWSVTTNPPQLKKEAPEPERPRVSSALVPVPVDGCRR
jgi:hypothetical protein